MDEITQLQNQHKYFTDWEYDRMSSSGQETLDKLCKVLNIETEAEMDEVLASMSKEEINNEILNRSL